MTQCSGPMTPMAVLVLGFVAERPMHPYEMVQLAMERWEDRLVKFRPGTLYHTVDRLAASGLIDVHEVRKEGNRPERTVYAITEAGHTALDESLREMLAANPDEFPQLYLALSEAHGLPRQEVIDLLTRRLTAMRAQLDEVVAATDTVRAGGIPEMFHLDTGCRIATLRVQIAWVEDLVDRLRERAIAWLDDPDSPYLHPESSRPGTAQKADR